jgi:hypothetical protein
MKILVTADDLVKRCVWDSYVYYIVGSDKDAQQILIENKEIEISEKDALVIGLLKIVETDNLVHKFNTYIVDLLSNKSIKEKDLLIKKKLFDASVDKFMNKFPNYWNPPTNWKVSIEQLTEYIENIKNQTSRLEVYQITDNNNIYEFYYTNNVKKLLKFQYG